MALMILPFFLQVVSTAPVELPHAPVFYTTENLIAVLIGVITATSGLVIWFVNKAIAAQEKREEKIDTLLAKMENRMTDLEKHKMVHEFGYKIVDERLLKLENWKEEMQRNHNG